MSSQVVSSVNLIPHMAMSPQASLATDTAVSQIFAVPSLATSAKIAPAPESDERMNAYFRAITCAQRTGIQAPHAMHSLSRPLATTAVRRGGVQTLRDIQIGPPPVQFNTGVGVCREGLAFISEGGALFVDGEGKMYHSQYDHLRPVVMMMAHLGKAPAFPQPNGEHELNVSLDEFCKWVLRTHIKNRSNPHAIRLHGSLANVAIRYLQKTKSGLQISDTTVSDSTSYRIQGFYVPRNNPKNLPEGFYLYCIRMMPTDGEIAGGKLLDSVIERAEVLSVDEIRTKTTV